jgi:hypothetical protein
MAVVFVYRGDEHGSCPSPERLRLLSRWLTDEDSLFCPCCLDRTNVRIGFAAYVAEVSRLNPEWMWARDEEVRVSML